MTEQEKEILEATKEFADIHNIPYDERIESMILNAMREVVKNCSIPDVMPRISHFVSEIGQEYKADDEAVLIEIQDGKLRFYEIGYDFERIYLNPVYVA